MQTKISELEAKVKEVKENIGGEEPATTAPPPPAEEKPEVLVAPPPEEKPEKPSPIEPPPQVSEPVGASHGASHTGEWVLIGGVGAVAVASLTVGIIENVMARNDMNTCNADADKVPAQLASAKAACDNAKPEAHWSYGLLAVGITAAAADVGLLYHYLADGNSNGLGLGRHLGELGVDARWRELERAWAVLIGPGLR